MNKPLTKPFFLAGVKYSSIKDLPPYRPNMVAWVTHNPQNAFDPFALEVRIDGVMVGHIPRTHQAPWFYHTINEVNVELRVTNFDLTVPYEEIQCVFECDSKYQTEVFKLGRILNK